MLAISLKIRICILAAFVALLVVIGFSVLDHGENTAATKLLAVHSNRRYGHSDHMDSPVSVSSLFERKAHLSKSDWDGLMERLIASKDVPFDERLRAFNELSYLNRLRMAQWFFDDFAENKSLDECLEFCSALPFDSESQHAVSRKLVSRIMDNCDFATAAEYIGRMDMGIAYATSRVAERDLPDSFHIKEVLDLKLRLPDTWRSAFLSCVATNPKSALDYREIKVLFTGTDNAELFNSAVRNLASTGKLGHSDVLDVMEHPILSDDQKMSILTNGAGSSSPPDISTFGHLFSGNLPPGLVDAYVRALPATIERNHPGDSAYFARLIPNAATRQHFLVNAATEWCLARGTTVGNPYLAALDPKEVQRIEDIVRTRPRAK